MSSDAPRLRPARRLVSKAAAVAGRSEPRPPLVAPFARALAVLGAFTPRERWLGNGDLAERTGLPPSTVSRLTQVLVALGYLLHQPVERKYRLSAAVLALGYAAFANSEVQRVARGQMQDFADGCGLLVCLASRDRLDLIVLESCSGAQVPVVLNLHVGARVGLASSPMGWALLGAVPPAEREYLMGSIARRMPREWSRLRPRVSQALAQLEEKGWCSAVGEWDRALGVVAAPVVIEGHEPRVLALIGASVHLGRARIERELAPRLLAMGQLLERLGQAA